MVSTEHYDPIGIVPLHALGKLEDLSRMRPSVDQIAQQYNAGGTFPSFIGVRLELIDKASKQIQSTMNIANRVHLSAGAVVGSARLRTNKADKRNGARLTSTLRLPFHATA